MDDRLPTRAVADADAVAVAVAIAFPAAALAPTLTARSTVYRVSLRRLPACSGKRIDVRLRVLFQLGGRLHCTEHYSKHWRPQAINQRPIQQR